MLKGTRTIQEIGEIVRKHHQEKKGLPPDRDLDMIIFTAMMSLRSRGYVKEVSKKKDRSEQMWKIYESPLRVLGDGKENVYLFYDPIDYERSRYIWACKIGSHKKQDVRGRVDAQTNQWTRKATIGLILKINKAVDLEKLIHVILKQVGRHRPDLPGREWFDTNPDEVIEIYKLYKTLK